jgi:hypothetical protein
MTAPGHTVKVNDLDSNRVEEKCGKPTTGTPSLLWVSPLYKISYFADQCRGSISLREEPVPLFYQDSVDVGSHSTKEISSRLLMLNPTTVWQSSNLQLNTHCHASSLHVLILRYCAFTRLFNYKHYYVLLSSVGRQLQAVDCDIDGRIVMEEIALVRAQRGARCPYYLGIPIEVDNQAILHNSFWHLVSEVWYSSYLGPRTACQAAVPRRIRWLLLGVAIK